MRYNYGMVESFRSRGQIVYTVISPDKSEMIIQGGLRTSVARIMVEDCLNNAATLTTDLAKRLYREATPYRIMQVRNAVYSLKEAFRITGWRIVPLTTMEDIARGVPTIYTLCKTHSYMGLVRNK